MKSPYDILGIEESATAEEIQAAYRALAKKHHPDVNTSPDARTRFEEILAAKDALLDKQGERKTVDPFADPFADLFSIFKRPWTFDNSDGLAEDVYLDLPLSLEEAIPGKKEHRISYSVWRRCDACIGKGCGTCKKNGRILQQKSAVIEIPPYCASGMRIKYKRLGNDSRNPDHTTGDLFVRIKILPHSRYGISGNDLRSQLRLTCIEAMLGTKLLVPTLLNGTVEIVVEAGIQHGDIINVGPYGAQPGGSYLLEVQIIVPTTMTLKQQDLLKQYLAEEK